MLEGRGVMEWSVLVLVLRDLERGWTDLTRLAFGDFVFIFGARYERWREKERGVEIWCFSGREK